MRRPSSIRVPMVRLHRQKVLDRSSRVNQDGTHVARIRQPARGVHSPSRCDASPLPRDSQHRKFTLRNSREGIKGCLRQDPESRFLFDCITPFRADPGLPAPPPASGSRSRDIPAILSQEIRGSHYAIAVAVTRENAFAEELIPHNVS